MTTKTTKTRKRKKQIKHPTLHKPRYRPSRDRKDKGFMPQPGVLRSEKTEIRRDRMSTQCAECDLPPVGKLNFEALSRVCIPAHNAFTPAELAVRLEVLAELAAARKPLFEPREWRT